MKYIAITILVIVVGVLLVLAIDPFNMKNDVKGPNTNTDQTQDEDLDNSDEDTSTDFINPSIRRNTFTSRKGIVLEITNPRPGELLTCPFFIDGIISTGAWYFEAEFTIDLVGSNGQVISTNIATAVGDWMTSDPVRFSSNINCEDSQLTESELVFNKSNPSSLLELDDNIVVPLHE